MLNFYLYMFFNEGRIMKKILSIAISFCLIFNLTGASLSYDNMNNSDVFIQNTPSTVTILDEEEALSQLSSTNNNYYNDPFYSLQWAISQTYVPLSWVKATKSSSVTVAIIDTGVDYTHDDLKNKVLVDEGYDFANDDSDPMDDHGHGTHVAGIIAAEADNGIGVCGITGKLDVKILPIKALNEKGAGEIVNIISAINYAISKNVDIINLSISTNIVNKDVRLAIQSAIAQDIFVVVAAGNNSTICSTSSLASLDGVFTVGATTDDNTLAYFSNYGSLVDAYAPGVGILSTYIDNQYAYQYGTSMAAPIISGAAAILLSQDPTLTVAELTSLLKYEATTSTTSTTISYDESLNFLRNSLMQATALAVSTSNTRYTSINIYKTFLKANISGYDTNIYLNQ